MDKNKTSVLVHFLIFLISEIFMTNCFSQMRFLFLPFNQMDQPGRLRPVFHLKISEVCCNKQREVLCTLYPCFTRIQKKKNLIPRQITQRLFPMTLTVLAGYGLGDKRSIWEWKWVKVEHVLWWGDMWGGSSLVALKISDPLALWAPGSKCSGPGITSTVLIQREASGLRSVWGTDLHTWHVKWNSTI